MEEDAVHRTTDVLAHLQIDAIVDLHIEEDVEHLLLITDVRSITEVVHESPADDVHHYQEDIVEVYPQDVDHQTFKFVFV